MKSLITSALALIALASAAIVASPSTASANPGARWACSGVINGTWGYKGGRAMTLTLSNYDYYGNVTVIVSQQNGSEATSGTCYANRDGSASVSFRGQFNFGEIYISPYGNASGMVSNFSFSGMKQ